MTRILQFIRQFPEYFVGTCLTLVLLTAGGLLSHAQLSTSYEVANEPQMFLDVNITASQTTGIVLAAPQINGSSVTLTTKTGGVLRIRSGFRTEDISYTSATVNATTFKVTLAGVTRNICRGTFKTFPTCGNGQAFSKGATVELIQDARLFNLKANIDRRNIFTGSGAITFSGSGSLSFPLFANATARDQQLQGTDSKVACLSSTNACYYRMGSAWISFGSGTTINATELVAGKVELGSVSDQSGATLTGETGAATVVQTRYLTASGGSAMRKRVPILDNRGYMSGTTLASNFAALTAAQKATHFLRGDQTFAIPRTFSGTNLIQSQTDHAVLTLDQATWTQLSANLSQSITFTAGDLVQFNFIGQGRRSAGDPLKTLLDIKIGNNPISPAGSGALAIDTTSATSLGNNSFNMSFTLFHRVATGGTLTVTPVYRNYAAGGAAFRIGTPTHFQVIRVNN